MTNIPEKLVKKWSLAMTIPALDTPSMTDPPPAWVDKEKFRRGQKFFWKHSLPFAISYFFAIAGSFINELCQKVLVFNRKFETTSGCAKRIADIQQYGIIWMKGDLWDPESNCYKSMVKLQKIHSWMGMYANKHWDKVVTSRDNPTLLPEVAKECIQWKAINKEVTNKGHEVYQFPYPSDVMYQSQFDSLTVVTGILIDAVTCSKKLGLHGATKEDFEDHLHTWRVLSYYLGIEDRFNPFVGNLEDVREYMEHYKAAFVIPAMYTLTRDNEYAIRLHIKAVHLIAPFTTYLLSSETLFMFFGWILDLDLPETAKSLKWYNKVLFALVRFMTFIAMRLSAVRYVCNRLVKLLLEDFKLSKNPEKSH